MCAIPMQMQKRSSWNSQEAADAAAGGAAAGSAGAAGGSALSSAAHDLQQISSTKDTMTQQQHRIRGKHGKLKK